MSTPTEIEQRSQDSIYRATMPSAVLGLVLIARHHGMHLESDRILIDNGLSKQPLTPTDLIKCANSIGMRATGFRPGWKGLSKLSKILPALIFCKDNNVMLLSEVRSTPLGQLVSIVDPRLDSRAALTLDRKAFHALWNGEVVIFQRSRKNSISVQDFSFKSIAALVFRERAMLRDIVVSAVMLSILALVPILFFRVMTERVLPYHALSTLSVVCLVTGILFAFEASFGALRRYLLLRLTTRVDVKITSDMFSRVLNLPVDYFERTPAGMTMHKMAQLGRVRAFLVGQLFGSVLDAGILLFFIPIMFYFAPMLTAIVLFFAAGICLWILCMLPMYKQRSSAVEKAEAERGAFLAQSIHGIRTIKTLALENRQLHDWDIMTAGLAQLRFSEGNLGNLIQSVITPLERMLVTGSFGVGVFMALRDNDATVTSTLLTFMLLSQRLAAPLIQASQFINQFDEARTAIGVVGSLINQAPEEGRSGNGVFNELRGHVAFSNVFFKYKGATKPALKGITLDIRPGTTLGVMGRSGSGKTTITRLLQRLNSDYSGLIKIDGIDVRNYDLAHYRASLGVVLQENFLFSGTIRANIAMGNPGASFDQVVHAARLAGAEEFVEKLPSGYETFIYEGSPNLSGGQRQRLAIARALITDPKILILDEATSALDAESEAIVNANIEKISRGRTVITISHRLASLVKADAILVMEQGEVNDIGRHDELLERNQIYAGLWYTQNPHATANTQTILRPQLTYQGPGNAA